MAKKTKGRETTKQPEISDAQTDTEKPTLGGIENEFSVIESLSGKTIFLIGGTGFLGRLMLFKLFKFIPGIKKIYLLIRPTHGQTGRDRLNREILTSPVFAVEAGDEEFFRQQAEEKIYVVEGDASRKGLNLTAEDAGKIRAEADVVLNTAGNVEFNPPLDLSLNANTIATLNVLDFTETMRNPRYVHISTCYVADRGLYPDRAPEVPVSPKVRSVKGADIVIDPLQEIDESLAEIERIKNKQDTEADIHYIERAKKELEKTGRSDPQGKLAARIAKNLRTFDLREELIKAGKERANRLNRPNVYTYTKTLAELIVLSRQKKVNSVIVRPSIVEASYRYPFPGWNEGVQGSAPLIYLMKKGHKMIPSLSTKTGERRDAVLDLIPVDMVAAGTILATAALVKDQNRKVYQLAAGPIDYPITITRMLNISQVSLRDQMREENRGLARLFRLNLQAVTVNRETFERYSSPRMLKVLDKARERLEKVDKEKLPAAGRGLFGSVQNNLEKFYNISMMKNRIFSEFMPFINHGYPTFENANTVELFESLPPQERELFYFAPFSIDYIDYLSRIHIPGIVKYVFPILDKRFAAIDKLNQSSGNQLPVIEEIRAIFSPETRNFRQHFSNLRDLALRRGKGGQTESVVSQLQGQPQRDPEKIIERSLQEFLQKNGKEYEKSVQDLAFHINLVYGETISVEEIEESKNVRRLAARLLRYQLARETSSHHVRLPIDGISVPDMISEPTRNFLFEVQMWFYRSVLNTEVRGKDNIPWNTSNVVVVANHASHIDYGLVQYALGKYGQKIGILAARDYFFNRFWKSTFFTNFMTLIPLDRSESNGYQEALKPAFDYLKSGGPILIFPEGTRSIDGHIQSFKHGLGYLVLKSGADVLPIQLSGTHDVLPKGARFIKSRDVAVSIGKIIPNEDFVEMTENMSPTRSYDTVSKFIEGSVRRTNV